jgi:hypothetical protein
MKYDFLQSTVPEADWSCQEALCLQPTFRERLRPGDSRVVTGTAIVGSRSSFLQNICISNWNQLEPIGTNWNHCGTTCSVLISEKRWNMLEHIVGQIGLSLATAEVVKSGPKRGPNSNAGK